MAWRDMAWCRVASRDIARFGARDVPKHTGVVWDGPGWSRVAWMGRVRWDGYGWGWVKGLHCVCMRLHECEAAMELDGVAEKIADEQCRNKE